MHAIILALLLLAACATTEPKPMLAPADIDRCTHENGQGGSAGLALLVHQPLELGPDA